MSSDALIKKAAALHEAGKLGEAALICRDILTAEPDNIIALHMLAVVAMHMDNPQMVLVLSDQGLRLNEQLHVFHQDKATALRRLGRKEEALTSINRAIELNPGEADYHDTRGAVLRDMRRYDEAVESYKKAVSLAPKNSKYYNSLAVCLGRMGNSEEALKYADICIQMNPREAAGYNNKANYLKAVGRYKEAIEFYEKALKLNPDIFMCRANKGMAHLVTGDYTEGWKLFEERKPGNKPPEADRFDVKRRWKGEEDKNATLVVYHEQGLGDTLQFCRYIPIIRGRVGKLIAQVQLPLKKFLSAQWPDVEMITGDDTLPDYTYQCPLMSLPHVLGTTPENIPFATGYVKADEAKVAAWKNRLPQDAKKKVGLVWAGNPDHMNDHIRSIPLDLFAPLWNLPNIHFYSLQKGDGALAQMAALPTSIAFTPLGHELNDFADTAALLKNLDLLLSVDTSVLHMAGALGVPSWAMLQFDPDWRWLVGRDDTPWYNSVKLFRQKKFADWAGVIGDVGRALA